MTFAQAIGRLSAICAWTLLHISAAAGEVPDLPPIPDGFDFKTSADSTAEGNESLRVDLILQKLREAGADTNKRIKLTGALKQQLTRMFHMEEATRNAALRLGVFQLGLEPDLDIDIAYLEALNAYAAELELFDLKRRAFRGIYIERIPDLPALDATVIQPMQFATYYFKVLKGRRIKLDDPFPGIGQLLDRNDGQVQASTILDDGAGFAVRSDTSWHLRQYIGLCLAFVPNSAARLKGMAAYFKAGADSGQRYLGEQASFFEECAAVNKIVTESPALKQSEVFARALAEGRGTRILKVRNAIASNVPANNRQILERAIELLRSKDDRSSEENERVAEYQRLLRQNSGISDLEAKTTKNIGGNLFFGF